MTSATTRAPARAACASGAASARARARPQAAARRARRAAKASRSRASRAAYFALKAAGVARGGKNGVRVLAKGEFSAKLTFKVAGASAAARAAIEAAGGSIELFEIVTAAEKAAAKKNSVRDADRAKHGKAPIGAA